MISARNIKPFEFFRIIVTKQDQTEAEHLLGVEKGSMLICPECGSRRFRVEVVMKAELEILAGNVNLITNEEQDVAFVNRVTECAHCGNKKDFICITPEDTED